MNLRKLLAAAFLAVSCASPSGAVVLSFDDVPGGSNDSFQGQLPSSNGYPDYGGFVFSENLNWFASIHPAYGFGSTSGDFTLLNQNAGVGMIERSDGGVFGFGGLYARSWWGAGNRPDLNPLLGFIAGIKDGLEIWRVSTSLGESFEYIEGNGLGIDQLQIGLGVFFLVDDLELTDPSVPNAPPVPSMPAVPIGQTLPLAAAAFCLLGLMGLRRQRTSRFRSWNGA